MPRLWSETIDEHRRSVHAAILHATAALVAEHGLARVSMSQIAQATGIGRATLYKYFPDVGAIMAAWHEDLVEHHLGQLAKARDDADDPAGRLRAVLSRYVALAGAGAGHELAGILHRGGHMPVAQQRLHQLLTTLIEEAVAAGRIRGDMPAAELAVFCLHALDAAGSLPSPDARERLVQLTVDALGVPGPHRATT
jgi:AcrR family transcriptional regulator